MTTEQKLRATSPREQDSQVTENPPRRNRGRAATGTVPQAEARPEGHNQRPPDADPRRQACARNSPRRRSTGGPSAAGLQPVRTLAEPGAHPGPDEDPGQAPARIAPRTPERPHRTEQEATGRALSTPLHHLQPHAEMLEPRPKGPGKRRSVPGTPGPEYLQPQTHRKAARDRGHRRTKGRVGHEPAPDQGRMAGTRPRGAAPRPTDQGAPPHPGAPDPQARHQDP